MTTIKSRNTTNVTKMTRAFPIERTRNIGVAAHIDAGKTTLTERMLLYAGAIHSAGEVHDGTTTMDFDPIEQKKGITIAAAAISCQWTLQGENGSATPFAGRQHRINIIDTPGHVDFTAEVERSMRVLDGAVIVFSGVEGVQPQSERVWRQAARHRVPRLAFVNKMDRLGADFDRVVADMRAKVGANAWPVLAPLGKESELRGQIDLIHGKALIATANDTFGRGYTVEELSAEERASAKTARERLVEAVADLDDVLADAYLAGAEITSAMLKAAIRRQTIANRFVPVIGGSAFKYVGVPPLLDAVIDYLPSPIDLPPPSGLDPETGEAMPIPAGDDEPLRALVFKLSTDESSRRRVFVRIYSGALRTGSWVYNSVTQRRERISRVSEIQADREIAIDAAYAGDIAVIAGLSEVATGHTLCALESPLLLEPPSFPEPVVSMAIEPATRADQERLGFVLQRLAEDDPTFKVTVDSETGETLIAGMGELHLEVIRERMLTQHRVATRAGAPQIAYRETITIAARGEGRHIKQNGGHGMHGHVYVEVSPREPGAGLEIVDRVIGGAIPRQFIGSVRKGIVDAVKNGPLGGYPMIDVSVAIVDGSFHAKDSNDLAFQIAGSLAFQEAVARARPVLLEPIMRVECSTPPEHQGDIVGDLGWRRGVIRDIRRDGDQAVIEAEAPLAQMFGYANAIRSLSRGRAEYSMAPARCEVVPAELAAKVLASRR